MTYFQLLLHSEAIIGENALLFSVCMYSMQTLSV